MAVRFLLNLNCTLDHKANAAASFYKEVLSDVPKIGSGVLLKDVKNKALWKLPRVVKNIRGRDGTILGFKINLGNGYVVERPLQMLCDLDIRGESNSMNLNPKRAVFVPRERGSRASKEVEKDHIKAMGLHESDEI